jgi:hypothetical protein
MVVAIRKFGCFGMLRFNCDSDKVTYAQTSMAIMCVSLLVTANKEQQTGAKSCKAGKLHSACKRALPDWRYKTIAAPRDIDNESIPIASIAQRAAQCRNMHREVGRLDKQVRPHPSHQLLLGDQLARPFEQDGEYMHGAAAERHRFVAFQQKKLRRQQAEWSE